MIENNKELLTKYIDYLVKWTRRQVLKANADGVVFGVSGGVDSALVSVIAKKAFPNNHLGLILPCASDEIDENLAKLHCEQQKIHYKKIDLTSNFNTFRGKLNLKSDLALSNIKPRLRMTTLYAIAQEHNYLVLGTDNACEWHLGYFTKHGDGAVDIAPIMNLLKKQVYDLARVLNISNEIIDREPSAGLWNGQTDEQEMGFTYNDMDDFLAKKEVSQEILNKIEAKHKSTQHKRRKVPKPYKKLDY